MGFLDSSSSIVTAILTRKGRELIAKNDGSFRITKFAFGDDEINYQLYNTATENDADILNLPILEPSSNENTALRYRLVTLPQGSVTMAYLLVNPTTIAVSSSLSKFTGVPNQSVIMVTTRNGSDPSGYIAVSRNTSIATVGSNRISSDPNLPFIDPTTGKQFTEQDARSGLINIVGGDIGGTTFIDIAGKDTGATISVPITNLASAQVNPAF